MLAVRRLGPGDEAVLALIANDAEDFDVAREERPEAPLAPADAAAYLASPAVVHWIAEQDGRVLGSLVCHELLLPYGARKELLLYVIGVREADRRRGVGRALLAEMRQHAEQAGIHEIWVLADNPDAVAFYAGCGFRRGEGDEQGVVMLLELDA